MVKKIKNLIEVTATLDYAGDIGVGLPYTIHDVSIHYGLECEHGDMGRKGLPLEQNQEILNIVKDFAEEGIKQAEVAEGVT